MRRRRRKAGGLFPQGTERVFSALVQRAWPDPFASVTTYWQSGERRFQLGSWRDGRAPRPPGKCEHVEVERLAPQVRTGPGRRCAYPWANRGASDPLSWPLTPFRPRNLSDGVREVGTPDPGKSPWKHTPHFSWRCNTGPALHSASARDQRRCLSDTVLSPRGHAPDSLALGPLICESEG